MQIDIAYEIAIEVPIALPLLFPCGATRVYYSLVKLLETFRQAAWGRAFWTSKWPAHKCSVVWAGGLRHA